MLILLQIENTSVTNENTSDDIKTDENLADETPQEDVEQADVPNQDPEQVNYFLFGHFHRHTKLATLMPTLYSHIPAVFVNIWILIC